MSWFGRTRRKHRVLVLGGRSSGKTTVLYRLSGQPVPESMVPTAADVLEKSVTTPDGHRVVLAEQKYVSPDAAAVIYVLSLPSLTAELRGLRDCVQGNSLRPRTPLLVLANKQDADLNLQAALDEITSMLAPIVGTQRSWSVLGCSASKAEDVREPVIAWLETVLPY